MADVREAGNTTEQDGDDPVCDVRKSRSTCFLQNLASPKTFTLLLSILGFLHGAYFTYLIGILSTIEKRYSYESKISGLILIADNISPIFISSLIGFFSRRSNRSHLVAWCMLPVVFANILFALPYFIYGSSSQFDFRDGPKDTTQFCDIYTSSIEEKCTIDVSIIQTIVVIGLFFLGAFFRGFGSTAFYTIGMPFLDDNIEKKNSPFYYDFISGFRRLFKNPVLMLHTIGLVLNLNGILGYLLVNPRYMEAHFRQSASDVSLYSGRSVDPKDKAFAMGTIEAIVCLFMSGYGEECMSIQMVRRWRSWFLEGRQNVHDDERSGRPVTATDNAAAAAVRNVVEAARRVTIDEIMIRLSPGIEIGRSSIGTIMSDILNFRKVCARWVPRLLLENHKQQRMEAARAFLEMHQRDGDQLLSRIVTGDESWVHHSTPETKRQSMVWKKPEESAPKKAKVTISAGKVMAMENFKWEIFTHPPYSPELAPSDLHLFPALKWHLGGKHFENDDEVQEEANHWLQRQDTA
ncbi:hypothetical protein LAZ67_1005174, partial [Cordylochernes scorpioides]